MFLQGRLGRPVLTFNKSLVLCIVSLLGALFLVGLFLMSCLFHPPSLSTIWFRLALDFVTPAVRDSFSTRFLQLKKMTPLFNVTQPLEFMCFYFFFHSCNYTCIIKCRLLLVPFPQLILMKNRYPPSYTKTKKKRLDRFWTIPL